MNTTMMQRYGKVAVMFGGRSAEREVSLKSGSAVLAALLRQGVDAHAFDPAVSPLSDLRSQGYSRVMIHLHGRGGEDGTIQGALECLGIPYTGPGVMASSMGMDKLRTKLIWKALGLRVPDFVVLDEHSDFDAVERQLGLPLFVKPACEGSSIGISRVTERGGLKAAWAIARAYDSVVLAERNIGGGEYTAAILGDRVLPFVKIEPATAFYDYEAKYNRDDTRYVCPAPLSAEQVAEVEHMVRRGFWAIGGSGWGRVDFLLDEQGLPYLLEVNTSPGMTDHSLVPMAARAAGISFDELVLHILDSARLAGEPRAHVA